MIKYNDVYSALSFHEWRNPIQLVDLIAEQKRIDSLKVNLGSIHGHLFRLCKEGYVD